LRNRVIITGKEVLDVNAIRTAGTDSEKSAEWLFDIVILAAR